MGFMLIPITKKNYRKHWVLLTPVKLLLIAFIPYLSSLDTAVEVFFLSDNTQFILTLQD